MKISITGWDGTGDDLFTERQAGRYLLRTKRDGGAYLPSVFDGAQKVFAGPKVPSLELARMIAECWLAQCCTTTIWANAQIVEALRQLHEGETYRAVWLTASGAEERSE